MKNTTVSDCKLIQVPNYINNYAVVSQVKSAIDIPFDIKRIFFLHDIPANEIRGAHAHKKQHQFLIAIRGSLNIQIDDGQNKMTINLHEPNMGLHMPPNIWGSLSGFSLDTILLVFTSEIYDEHDYIRDYSTFLRLKSHL